MSFLRSFVAPVCAVLAGSIALGCEKPEPTVREKPTLSPRGYDGSINARLLHRFAPVPVNGFSPPMNEALTTLGHTLFFDPRLSKDQTVSCASCHDLSSGGADLRPNVAAPGDDLHRRRNAPTVLNAAGAFAQSWDGQTDSVEQQALGPILNPSVMGMTSAAAVATRLQRVRGYTELFRAAFPDEERPITLDNVGRAIGAYERKLSTPGRWDKFLAGDKSALTLMEKEGLRTFLNVGCMVCHTGPLVGGSMFERVGAVEPWPNQSDPGRMAVTKREADRMVFKVPTLRNVARTAPYFHDSSAATLPAAIRKMGKHQLGIELTKREVDAIAAWLTALDGDAAAALVLAPSLPP